MARTPKISVIIPSCNRPKELEETVKSILRCDYKNLEVIVALDADTRSLLILKKLQRTHKNIKILFSRRKRGRCKAKNEALKMARGEIIVFFDDDVIVDKNYFRMILPHYSNPQVAGVGGKEIKISPQPRVRRIWLSMRNEVGKIHLNGEVVSNFDFYNKVSEVDTFVGCNMSFRKKVLLEVNGFDENYDIGTAYREETDLCWRIRKKGFKLIFEPKALVIHKEFGGPEELRKWAHSYFINHTYFFMKNLYQGNTFRIIQFLLKELVGSCLRTLAYKKPYFLFYYPRIFTGIRFYFKVITRSNRYSYTH